MFNRNRQPKNTEEKKAPSTPEEQLDQLQKRLDLLDSRLDNIDSMVTAVAERVMVRPVTIITSCPHCNKKIEIAIIGAQKPTP